MFFNVFDFKEKNNNNYFYSEEKPSKLPLLLISFALTLRAPIDVFSHVVSSFANCLEKKKVLTRKKSSIPTGIVLYTNMAAE